MPRPSVDPDPAAPAPVDDEIRKVVEYVRTIILGQVPIRLRGSVSIDPDVRAREEDGDGISAAIHCHVQGPHEALARVIGREGATLRAIERLAQTAGYHAHAFVFIHVA